MYIPQADMQTPVRATVIPITAADLAQIPLLQKRLRLIRIINGTLRIYLFPFRYAANKNFSQKIGKNSHVSVQSHKN